MRSWRTAGTRPASPLRVRSHSSEKREHGLLTALFTVHDGGHQVIEGCPMYPLPAQPRFGLLLFAPRATNFAFRLARIGHAGTEPAAKCASAQVEHRRAPTTTRTSEPGTTSSVCACGALEPDPMVAWPALGRIAQPQDIGLGARADDPHSLASAAPSRRAGYTWRQEPGALQHAHVYAQALFGFHLPARPAGSVSDPATSHVRRSTEYEIIRQLIGSPEASLELTLEKFRGPAPRLSSNLR